MFGGMSEVRRLRCLTLCLLCAAARRMEASSLPSSRRTPLLGSSTLPVHKCLCGACQPPRHAPPTHPTPPCHIMRPAPPASPQELKRKLSDPQLNISMENHMFGLPPAHYEKWPALRENYHLLTTSKDRCGGWGKGAVQRRPAGARVDGARRPPPGRACA